MAIKPEIKTVNMMKKAFTMVELIVTIVILSILAAIAIPYFQEVIYKSKVKVTILEACALQREANALAKFSNRSSLTSEDFTTNDFDKITSGVQRAIDLTSPWPYKSEHDITVYIQTDGKVTLDQAGTEEEIDCANQTTSIATPTPTPTFFAQFDTQGGSSVTAQSLTSTETVTEPTPPTKAGYNFLGWFTNQTGGSAITFPYTHNQTTSFTLYAQWSTQTLPVTSEDGTTTIAGPGTFEDNFNGITIIRSSTGTKLLFNSANWEFIETTYTTQDTLFKTQGPNNVGPMTKNSNTDIDISIPYGNSFSLKVKYNGGSSGMIYTIG